jgi:hypothetical protein
MDDQLARTERRLHELRTVHGYEVEVVWSCELKEQLRHNRVLRQWWQEIDVPGPLDPRKDALRGGRVEPFRFAYVCRRPLREEIIKLDVVSFPLKKTKTTTTLNIFRIHSTPL